MKHNSTQSASRSTRGKLTITLDPANSSKLRQLGLGKKTEHQFAEWFANNAIRSFCNMDSFPTKELGYFFFDKSRA